MRRVLQIFAVRNRKPGLCRYGLDVNMAHNSTINAHVRRDMVSQPHAPAVRALLHEHERKGTHGLKLACDDGAIAQLELDAGGVGSSRLVHRRLRPPRHAVHEGLTQLDVVHSFSRGEAGPTFLARSRGMERRRGLVTEVNEGAWGPRRPHVRRSLWRGGPV